MRRIMISTLLMIFALSLFSNSLTKDLAQKAVSAYQNKNYEQALEFYKQIENESIKNSDIYYNIGNCYFRLSKIGMAILYYKKALKIDPKNAPAKDNLDFALTFTQDKQKIESDDLISSLWHRILNFFNLNLLSIILLILFAIIIFLIDMMIIKFRHREKTVPLFITFIFIFIFIIFAFITVVRRNMLYDDSSAVIISSTVAGYSGPGEGFTRVFTIHEGMIFQIEKQEGDWSLIKLQNGLGGWIPSDLFLRI